MAQIAGITSSFWGDGRQSGPYAANKSVASLGTDMAKSPACSRLRFPGGNPAMDLRMKRRRMQVFYSGQVQGVGFRYQTRQVAAGFEVTGRVRNLPDGRVDLLAEGAETELREFRVAIRESGLGPLIKNEDEIWSEANGEFRGFVIAP